LLLAINSNFGRISYRFRDVNGAFSSKMFSNFNKSSLFDAPSGGTPCDINAIYTPLKSTFSGLQFYRWQYGPSTIAGQGYPTSSILVSIERAYATSY